MGRARRGRSGGVGGGAEKRTGQLSAAVRSDSEDEYGGGGGGGRVGGGVWRGKRDRLVRGELSEDEMRDELDQFEADLSGAGGGGAAPLALHDTVKASRQRGVLVFDDDSDGDDDEEYMDNYGAAAAGSHDDNDDDADDDGNDDDDDDERSSGWGRQKWAYYGSEVVDESWRGANREEVRETAELEEQEALAIQQRMAALISQDQLQLTEDHHTIGGDDEGGDNQQQLQQLAQLNMNQLTPAEQKQLLMCQWPELLPLINRLSSCWQQLVTTAEPLCKLVDDAVVVVVDADASRLVASYRRLLLAQCLNITHYLSQRCRNSGTSGNSDNSDLLLRRRRSCSSTSQLQPDHPMLNRIAQLVQLSNSLQPIIEKLKGEMTQLVKMAAAGSAQSNKMAAAGSAQSNKMAAAGSAQSNKMAAAGSAQSNKMAAAGSAQSAMSEQSSDEGGDGVCNASSARSELCKNRLAYEKELKRLSIETGLLQKEQQRRDGQNDGKPHVKSFTELRSEGQSRHNPLDPFRKKRPSQPSVVSSSQTTGQNVTHSAATDGAAVAAVAEKRPITHDIAKNKGLMPKRSRESRNPRVKHKVKFQKALKKRRSMTRLPRKEVQRYGGEMCGIRMGTVKSIPIK